MLLIACLNCDPVAAERLAPTNSQQIPLLTHLVNRGQTFPLRPGHCPWLDPSGSWVRTPYQLLGMGIRSVPKTHLGNYTQEFTQIPNFLLMIVIPVICIIYATVVAF